MRFAALLVLAASAFAARLAPLITAQNGIEDEYIVVLKDDVSSLSFTEHKAWLFDRLRQVNVVRTNSFFNVEHFFDFQNFKGYSINADAEFVAALREMSEVDYIEQNQIFTIQGVQNNPPSWGLDRTSQRNLPLDSKYFYSDNAGAGITVYVVDTGVNIDATDLAGRASFGFSSISGESNTDGNGHGTHVAGTIAGTTYGIAKKANIVAVKVLSSAGSGTTSGVIKGVEYVANNAKSGYSVANMSLGGSKSTSLDNAVNAAINAGVVFVVAAGNDASNACNYSPAGVANAVTVGATTKADALASFSNRGSCVDVNAPGQDITSLWIGSNTATRTISGTSMASPHVAGVSALFLGDLPSSATRTPANVKASIVDVSTKSVLTGIPSGTINALLFNNPPSSF